MATHNTKAQDDKNQKILAGLLAQPDNKKCMDCKEKGPIYAVTTFGTFVCQNCSGIHREFGHRVKSRSLASFTPQEMQLLENMGNGVSIFLLLFLKKPFRQKSITKSIFNVMYRKQNKYG